MNAARFFRQDVVVQALASRDDYAGNTYTDPLVIKARWADVERSIRTARGVDIVSETLVSTLQRLQEGDLVTGPDGTVRTVVSVREARDVDGRLSHHVAVMR